MQKLIAKYGVAAHLAILAVAPLFLFAFFGDAQIATVLLWLSVPASAWIILEPSVRSGESLNNARYRVLRAIRSDPLFWISLFLVAVAGVRALNGGVALSYDAELAKWNVLPSVLPVFPCCVTGAGFLPFATLVAATILMQGCRHSLGRSARMAFLLLVSGLAGLAAGLVLFSAQSGNGVVREAMACSATASSHVGVSFLLCLLCGTVALVAAFEQQWKMMMPLFVLSIGGTAVVGFLLSPALVSLVFVAAEVLLLAYALVYAARILSTAGEFKLLVVLLVSLTLGVLSIMALEPSVAAERVKAFVAWEFVPDSLLAVRDALSGVALRSWFSNLWLGTGLGSFPLTFRFEATPADWQVVRAGAQTVPNGWLFLLAERGIVGVLIVGLPVGCLLYAYVRRLFGWVLTRTYCHPACGLGPLVLVALAVTGVYSCSFLRADVIIVAVAMLAISANSFPRTGRKDNG